MRDIENAFKSYGSSVYNFYQRPGIGFYVPLYQREYSWDKENIEQLIEDITRGIDALCESNDEIRFLGTLISFNEIDKSRIQPQDFRALPSAIESIIDGQQRISTIAILACRLYDTLQDLEKKLPNNTPYDELKSISSNWRKKLKDIFALNLNRGTPPYKPKIIRGQDDQWAKDGSDDYHSPVAKYLAKFIDYVEGITPKLDSYPDDKVLKNVRIINRWIRESLRYGHEKTKDDNIPKAWTILEKINQEYIWDYERIDLKDIVGKRNNFDRKSLEYITCSFVQVFAACHYILERCCFTIIQPVSGVSAEDWAFDMFQSLNATGTPLTAIETFKPLVVNTTENPKGDGNIKRDFKGSLEEDYFDKVEELFVGVTAATKNKRTNDFLTSFAITVTDHPKDGKLSSQFSQQRKWLEKTYSKELKARSYAEQQRFVKYMGQYAEFYNKIWLNYTGANNQPLNPILGHKDAQLASLLFLFLRERNHKMAITILAQFYIQIIENGSTLQAQNNFVDSCKIVAGFYVLWSAVKSNSGLDSKYRHFFKGDTSKSTPPQAWLKRNTPVTVHTLKQYFSEVLKEEKFNDKSQWVNQATSELSYENAKTVCKFLLFLTAHDTIVDDSIPGLIMEGRPGCNAYLTLERWKDETLKTIEHIAPQNPLVNTQWDDKLYEENNKLIHSIGNLTLLPNGVNASVSNKEWQEKLIYYKHLGEENPMIWDNLKQEAQLLGITLDTKTIKLLRDANYNAHIKPITQFNNGATWDADIVEQRTQRMLEIAWDRISKWVF